MEILFIVLMSFAVALFIVVVSGAFSGGQKKSSQREAYDPLDGSRLTDPVSLQIPAAAYANRPDGVRVRVNRANAHKFKQYGPKAFPNCFDRSGSGSYYFYNDMGGWDLVDMFILHQMFFDSAANPSVDDLQARFDDLNGSAGLEEAVQIEELPAASYEVSAYADDSSSRSSGYDSPSYEASSRFDTGGYDSTPSYDSGGGGGCDCGGGDCGGGGGCD